MIIIAYFSPTCSLVDGTGLIIISAVNETSCFFTEDRFNL